MVGLEKLSSDIKQSLTGFLVEFKETSLVKGMSYQFVVEDFGLVVSCINIISYTQVLEALKNEYKGYRYVFITAEDDFEEKRLEILFSLMRGGYMKWLRLSFPRQLNNILFGNENLASIIINERLRIWAELPRYKFLIEDNKMAMQSDLKRELGHDPSFFDYMPGDPN